MLSCHMRIAAVMMERADGVIQKGHVVGAGRIRKGFGGEETLDLYCRSGLARRQARDFQGTHVECGGG